MKRNFLLIALVACSAFLLTSCASTSSHTVSGVNLNGRYVLTNVDIQGIDYGSVKTEVVNKDTATIIHNVKVSSTVFDDASPSCFQGSVWNLPHNGNGSYTINQGDCNAGQRNIVWSVRTDANGQKIFQMKILDGRKAKQITDGYWLNLTNVTANGFTLYTPITVGNSQASVYYTFSKQ